MVVEDSDDEGDHLCDAPVSEEMREEDSFLKLSKETHEEDSFLKLSKETSRTNKQRQSSLSALTSLLLALVTISMTVVFAEMQRRMYSGAADDDINKEHTHHMEDIEQIRRSWLDRIPAGEPLRVSIIHVGKAGGTGLKATLSQTAAPPTLKARSRCWEKGSKMNSKPAHLLSLQEAWSCGMKLDDKYCQKLANEPSSLNNPKIALEEYIFAECHVKCDPKSAALNDANTYLFTTRLPISRLVSAFNYWKDKSVYKAAKGAVGHQSVLADRIFKDCFENINQATQYLLTEGLTPRSELPAWNVDPKEASCKDMIQNVFLGLIPDEQKIWHFVHGFSSYKSLVDNARFPEAPIVVARNEHQLEDLHNLDEALGGDGVFPAVYQNAQHHFYETIETTEGRNIVCCVIWEDIQAYQDIILSAVNLNNMQKQEAVLGAFDECGVPHPSNVTGTADTPVFSWSSWASTECSKHYNQR